MSRSYKKNPVVKDKSKFMHRHHNKKVRREPVNLEESAPRERKLYRKKANPWDITDWVVRWTKKWEVFFLM